MDLLSLVLNIKRILRIQNLSKYKKGLLNALLYTRRVAVVRLTGGL